MSDVMTQYQQLKKLWKLAKCSEWYPKLFAYPAKSSPMESQIRNLRRCIEAYCDSHERHCAAIRQDIAGIFGEELARPQRGSE